MAIMMSVLAAQAAVRLTLASTSVVAFASGQVSGAPSPGPTQARLTQWPGLAQARGPDQEGSISLVTVVTVVLCL
jgi:hypothetical protein